jgi:catechol-2,3-dioxygenase
VPPQRRVDLGVTPSICLTDPDGNEIELVNERPRELWQGDIDAMRNRAIERSVTD